MFDAKRIENDEPQKPNLVAHKTRGKKMKSANLAKSPKNPPLNVLLPSKKRDVKTTVISQGRLFFLSHSNSVGHPKRVVRPLGAQPL